MHAVLVYISPECRLSKLLSKEVSVTLMHIDFHFLFLNPGWTKVGLHLKLAGSLTCQVNNVSS